MKLRLILKRSLGLCFDFGGSKFVSSGDLLFIKYFIHKLSRYQFIQLRKCQRGGFQNHGVRGQAFPFLASPPPPRSSHQCCARPSFRASNGWKNPRKRLLRRLHLLPLLAALSELRLNNMKLFVTVGIDFTGHRMVTNGSKTLHITVASSSVAPHAMSCQLGVGDLHTRLLISSFRCSDALFWRFL